MNFPPTNRAVSQRLYCKNDPMDAHYFHYEIGIWAMFNQKRKKKQKQFQLKKNFRLKKIKIKTCSHIPHDEDVFSFQKKKKLFISMAYRRKLYGCRKINSIKSPGCGSSPQKNVSPAYARLSV